MGLNTWPTPTNKTDDEIRQAEENLIKPESGNLETNNQINQNESQDKKIEIKTLAEQQELAKYWNSFYKDFFEVTIDPEDILIPEQKEGFDLLLVIKPMAIPGIVEKLQEKMNVKMFKDNTPLDPNDIEKRRAYAIWLKNLPEAMEYPGISVNELGKKVTGITLQERLILSAKALFDGQAQPDKIYITYCSGSSYYNHEATPWVREYDFGMVIDLGSSDDKGKYSSIREVIR